MHGKNTNEPGFCHMTSKKWNYTIQVRSAHRMSLIEIDFTSNVIDWKNEMSMIRLYQWLSHWLSLTDHE